MKFNSKILFKIILGIIFLFGIFLRISVYILNRSFWHDECSLAVNILNKGFLEYFGILEHLQSAPPIFMIGSKLIYSLFPSYPELALRLIPFLVSVLSLFVFYIFIKKFISNKVFILIGVFLFSINFQLVYYSQEFKQYSLDVLMIMVSILFYIKYKFETINFKQKIWYAIITAILPFISLPTIFVVFSAITNSLFRIKKDLMKSYFIVLAPFLVLNFWYYVFSLRPAKKLMLTTLADMWNQGFFSLDFYSNFLIIKNLLLFLFNPSNFYILGLILCFVGLILLLKRKTYNDLIVLITTLFILLASALQVYPIRERVSLYLIPILLVYIFSAAAINFTKKNIRAIVMSIFLIVFISGYNLHYLKNITHNSIFVRKDSRSVLLELSKKYKPDEWVIINDASDSDFEFYGSYYKLINPKLKFGKILMIKHDEVWYKTVLDSIPKGNKYWFCYPYDYVKSPAIPYLKSWIKDNAKVLYEYEKDSSYLVLIQI